MRGCELPTQVVSSTDIPQNWWRLGLEKYFTPLAYSHARDLVVTLVRFNRGRPRARGGCGAVTTIWFIQRGHTTIDERKDLRRKMFQLFFSVSSICICSNASVTVSDACVTVCLATLCRHVDSRIWGCLVRCSWAVAAYSGTADRVRAPSFSPLQLLFWSHGRRLATPLNAWWRPVSIFV